MLPSQLPPPLVVLGQTTSFSCQLHFPCRRDEGNFLRSRLSRPLGHCESRPPTQSQQPRPCCVPSRPKLAPQSSAVSIAWRRAATRQARCHSVRSWSSSQASSAWHKSMASGSGADKKAEKSTWASAVESINPWSVSRSSTPTPKEPPAPPPPKPAPAPQGGDHSINPIYGISARKYPPDCPPLKVQWFHAVDVGLHAHSSR